LLGRSRFRLPFRGAVKHPQPLNLASDFRAQLRRLQDFGGGAEAEEERFDFDRAVHGPLGDRAAAGVAAELLRGVHPFFAEVAGGCGGEAGPDGFHGAIALEDPERAGEQIAGVEVSRAVELQRLHFDSGEAIDFERADLAVAGGMGQQVQG
jgi:hypothetical protein